MKMKLFAAAVAALAAGGAYAQSSVTLYGVADVGLEYTNRTPGPNGQSSNAWRMTSGNQSGSRWGLRGVEDLGGGLKGIFTLESGFNVDTGGQSDSSRLFNRNAYVGLQNQWGTLTLGRQQTLFYDFGLVYDPMAISTRYSITSIAPEYASRADNAAKYVGTFGGLTVAALYELPEQRQRNPGVFSAGREYGFTAMYGAGPFSVGATYDQSNGSTAASAGQSIRRASVAGTYAFGPAKVYAGYRWAKGYNGATLPGAVASAPGSVVSTANLYWLGLGYQLTPALSLTGAAYYQDFRNTSADPWQFVATADYALSKRTDLYTSVSYTKNKSGSSLGVDGYNSSTASNVISGGNQFGAVVGVRHKF